MRYRTRNPQVFMLLLLLPAGMAASQPWARKDPQQWTTADTSHLLLDSPWAQQTGVTFGIKPEEEYVPPQLPGAAEAGLPGQQQSNIHWDGGVGRNDRYNTPTLNVTVRWDSALPERLALARDQTLDKSSVAPYSAEQAGKDYIITIVGLVPGGRYRTVGSPAAVSSSDDSVDSRNPEPLLEGLMVNSRLLTATGAIRPENVKLDGETGTLHFFFSREHAINLSDKEVVFESRFGSLTVSQKFRLKDMVYKGKLEL